MGFIRVSQNGEEFLLNVNHIVKISKGKEKYEFIILLKGESNSRIYEIFGSGGIRCEKLLAVKKLTQLIEKEG